MGLSRAVPAGLVAIIFGGVILALAVGPEAGGEAAMLCLAGVLALAAAALPVFVRRRYDVLEPLSGVLLIVGLGVTAKAFYLALGPEGRVRSFLLLGKGLETMLTTTLLIALALFVFSLGYLLGNVRWRLSGWRSLTCGAWGGRRFYAVVGVLLIVGLLSAVVFSSRTDIEIDEIADLSSKRWAKVQGSQYRGSEGYLRTGALLPELAFYIALAGSLASRRLRPATGVVLAVLFLAAIAFPFLTSSRQTLAFVVLRAILIWICFRGVPRWRYLGAALLAGLLFLGLMTTLRRGASQWQTVRTAIGIEGLLEITVGGRHALDLTKTAHVIAGVPEAVDYQYGKSLVAWVLAPVPRAMWPAKPPVGIGVVLGPAIFGTQRSGVGPGIVAELYLNFGLLGIFVGMLALGILLRSLYATFLPFLHLPAAVVLYVILVTRLAVDMMSNSVSMSILQLLQELLPLLVAYHFLAGSAGEDPAHGGARREEPLEQPPAVTAEAVA